MTIYALSSGPGISGVAVIRVSGKKTKAVIKKQSHTFEVLQTFFEHHNLKKNLPFLNHQEEGME